MKLFATGPFVSAAAMAACLSGSAMAQDYMLPNTPGKAAVTGACESCHGIMTVIGHGKRSPKQWDAIVHQMMAMGAKINEDQSKTIIGYLNANYGQPTDYVPPPPKPIPRSPGLALALEAAQAAEADCLAKGYAKIGTLVVDAEGNVLVFLAAPGANLNANIVSAKTNAVLKYKMTSGELMKRLENDPALVEEIKADPKIREVRQGALPITVNGEIIGAITVSGDTGPVDKDEICAKVGLDKIAGRLK